MHVDEEFEGPSTITGGMIIARAEETAVGVAVEGLQMRIDGARIVAEGPREAIGVNWVADDVISIGTVRLSLSLEDVFAQSSGTGLSIELRQTGRDPNIDVARSQLLGAAHAIEIADDAGDVGLGVSIEGSLLQGEEWVTTTTGRAHVIEVSGSVLDGMMNATGATLECTDVLSGDYRPLDRHCLPQ
jgi:hypothetical protein